MKWYTWLIIASMLVTIGCIQAKAPERSIDFKNPKEATKSYFDYLYLENHGIETIQLKSRQFNRTVSLAYYLYTIAQSFESFGRDDDAAKLYLRMLMRYPLLHEGGQLGVLAENRLKWLIGDKRWIVRSVDELILKLERSLRTGDVEGLKNVASRDFGFGRTRSERYAVKYEEGIQLIANDFRSSFKPAVEIIEKVEDEKVILKTTGWNEGKKNWYFSLHKNDRIQGWEWDLAYWEDDLE